MQGVEKQLKMVRVTSVEDALTILKRAVARGEYVPKEVIARLGATTTLDLGHGDLGAKRAKMLASAIASMPALTSLILANNPLEAAGVEILARAFPKLPSLTTIDLSYNELRNEGAAILGSRLPSLPALSHLLLTCNAIRDDGAKALARGIASLVFLEAFATLELTGNRIGSAGAGALAEVVPDLVGLRSLGLGGGFIGPAGSAVLVDALPRAIALESLNLQGNRSGPDSARRAVELSSPRLAALDLGGNKLCDEGQQDDAFRKRARRTRHVYREPENDLIGLAGALSLKTSLTELSLANNALRDDFIAAVSHFGTLRALNLSLNLLARFDPMLLDLPHLTALDVSFNGISELPESIGRSALARGLRKLDLRRNNLAALPRSVALLPRDCTLCVVANPLRDPPLAVSVHGVDAISSYFRSQPESKEDVHRPPPPPVHFFSPPPGLSHHYRPSSIDAADLAVPPLSAFGTNSARRAADARQDSHSVDTLDSESPS
ncbi:hypothetical protein CTAYLR_000410 [Chrysophaeum taylorii]|uniref:Uncharacterized protein n=1 Tax=Chrysophaeum taylorii TaxID=2483200 RepID=A0AAD7UHF6_9STRA|nr:hypothetical protein CTAYLR_000410 [Chrysophaeum taylorii]